MKWHRVFLYFPLFCCAVSLNAHSQVVWLSPRPAADYLSLFEKNAPWERVSAQVSVIAMPVNFILNRPDGDLQKIFADMRRRRIKLGVQFMALSGRPNPDAPECGLGVEGYSAKGEPLLIARKVKRLGGQIEYLGMDEPLFFGHRFDRYQEAEHNPRRRGCQLSIAEVAADAAERIQMVRTVFPDVIVGEAEPIMEFGEADWRADLSTWFDAVHKATGQKLGFFRLDLRWRQAWRPRMPQLAGLLQKDGIPLQVIYNGSSPNDDAAWVREAEQRFKEFEGDARIKPESVVFQSWAPSPSRALPESDARTMTGLVNTYLKWKAQRGEVVKRLDP